MVTHKSSKAGPSSPPRQPLSKDIIDSSDEQDDEEMEVDEEEENQSVDSLEDLERVTPKKKDREVAELNRKRAPPRLQKYQPPMGMVPVAADLTLDESPFDYAQLERNPKLQLWAIRIPADLKPSRLAALNVVPPSSSSNNPKGSLITKHGSYDLRSAGDGGDEMSGMRLMVPHSQQNSRFFPSPIPISQHLMLVPRSDSALESQDGIAEMDLDPPPKRKQPTHLFKFRNHAYGYNTPGTVETVAEASDVSMSPKTSKKGKKERADRPAKKSRPSKSA